MAEFTSDFFKNNRHNLASTLEGGLVILASNTETQKIGDQANEFLQEPSFWYLTGINLPNWHMIYDGTRDHCYLVYPKLSEVEQIFGGSTDTEAVMMSSGADELVAIDDMERLLRTLSRKHSTVYSLKLESQSFELNPAPGDLMNQLDRIFGRVIDCSQNITRLRAIKQPIEIEAIKSAIDITIQAFESAKQNLSACRFEYDLEAEFSYHFRRSNAKHAYDPIVASGKNACTLHYVANNSKLKKNQPVLCDIGARFMNYNADITRMLLNGKLTKKQRLIYDNLASAQSEIIKLIEPGLPIADYFNRSNELLTEALRRSNIPFEGTDQQTLVKYMPHAISHGLGLDVHDSLGRPRVFEPGMVITVEPGFYFKEEGFGYRIEDDVAITESGHVNLSAGLSTELVDI